MARAKELRETYKEAYNDAIDDVLAVLRDCENERERQRALVTISQMRLRR